MKSNLALRKNKRKKGFTLIELIIVIAILAILAAVAVPNISGLIKKASDATALAAAAEVANAINMYNADPANKSSKITGYADAVTKLGAYGTWPDIDSSITLSDSWFTTTAGGNFKAKNGGGAPDPSTSS